MCGVARKKWKVSDDWKTDVIIPFIKGKSERRDCISC